VSGTLLIDSIVRQTTVLIATLATATGNRASLAHVANQVLSNLAAELKSQGIGNKVIADMFGMALRTYHDKVARLAESKSESGRSLWDAVLGHLEQHQVLLRADLLTHFSRDDAAVVRSVLRDLVRSGLVFRSGHGDHTSFRAATPEERGLLFREHPDGRATMILVAVHQHGPLRREEIQGLVPLTDAALDTALAQLVADTRLQSELRGDQLVYRAERVFISYDDPTGWQAAVFDHYQALVLAVCAKVRAGRTTAQSDESIGGSTYHLDVWAGHPLEREALGFLAGMRRQAVALRHAIEQHNAEHPRPPDAREQRVIVYVGQTVTMEEDAHEDDS
jgi:hypothetical protein